MIRPTPSRVPYLNEHPDPTLADIRRAMAGNICPCTGHENVVRLIEATAGVMQDG